MQGQQFALHEDLPDVDADAYFDDVVGVPGGLFAAYVDGTRNGYQAQYLATLPNIVTDKIADCPSAPDEYYRLPWQGGTVEKVTQGNNTTSPTTATGSTPTTSGSKAESIRAARGGVVEWVEESYTQNSNPKVVKLLEQIDPELAKQYAKPANALRIKHQDGFASVYYHMPTDGVLVEEGDIVHRGDKVAIVGNTGNSTGPHLHFEVDDGWVSTWSRFEIGFGGQTISCVVPVKLPYISSNY